MPRTTRLVQSLQKGCYRPISPAAYPKIPPHIFTTATNLAKFRMFASPSPAYPRLLVLCMLAFTLSSLPSNARVWTNSKTGKTLEAEFVQLTESAVIVKPTNGKQRTLPLEFLTEADLTEAKKLQYKADGYGEPDRPELPDNDGPVELLISAFQICCDKSANEFTKAAGSAGAIAKINARIAQASLTAPSSKIAQDAVDAISTAGFYGDVIAKKGDTQVQFYTNRTPPETVSTATFILPKPVCCEHTANDLNTAIQNVTGIESGEASEGSLSITLTGTFDPQDVLKSIRARGINVTRR